MPGSAKRHVNVKNAEIVRRSDYRAVLETITAEGECPFCEERLGRHHRSPILFKTKYWMATTNAWPYEGSRHHFLLIARAHIERAEALAADAWKDLGAAYRKLVREHSITGATLFMRSGRTDMTGATVAHLHAQIVTGVPHGAETETITALIGFKKKK